MHWKGSGQSPQVTERNLMFPFLFNMHNTSIRFKPTNSSAAILRVLFLMDLYITGYHLGYHCPGCLGQISMMTGQEISFFKYNSYSLHFSKSEKCTVYILHHWKLLCSQTKGDLIFLKTTFFFFYLCRPFQYSVLSLNYKHSTWYKGTQELIVTSFIYVSLRLIGFIASLLPNCI